MRLPRRACRGRHRNCRRLRRNGMAPYQFGFARRERRQRDRCRIDRGGGRSSRVPPRASELALRATRGRRFRKSFERAGRRCASAKFLAVCDQVLQAVDLGHLRGRAFSTAVSSAHAMPQVVPGRRATMPATIAMLPARDFNRGSVSPPGPQRSGCGRRGHETPRADGP